MTALGLAGMAIGWAILIGLILYPAFHALLLRWWASGIRFGDLAVTSKLRTGQVYGAYLRFIGWSTLFGFAGSIVVGICLGIIGFLLTSEGSQAREILAVVLFLVAYVIIALGFSTIYQVKVSLGLWRMTVDSLELTNPAALEAVTSVGATASPVGEGLADALNVGGF
jgi:uncharacterized membrane protein YjgN (DUF898 family)